jgi:ribose/xylose/arabinose/galactoside ABC-type transport system permease subunit
VEAERSFEDFEPPHQRLLEAAERFWPWLFLLALLVVFSATGRGFFDAFNVQRIGANARSA